jgi:ATP-binding cassette subfamily F protein uup
LVVSHDRAFVDNIVTQTLSPLGDGRWRESVGGYSDWLREREATARAGAPRPAEPEPEPTPTSPTPNTKSKAKLSYKEERELAALPLEIETLEAEQRRLTDALSAPDYPHSDTARVTADGARIAEIEAQLMQKLERWEHLEAESQRLKSR